MLALDRSTFPSDAEVRPPAELPPFEAIYDAHFPYIWRSVQRLGVAPG